MSSARGQLGNPYSSGGGGVIFETRVQTSFVVLMAAGGYVSCFPNYPITRIKLQGRYAGYDTDDLIVFTKASDDGRERKLLGQIKHRIEINKSSDVFGEVIQAAWDDFGKAHLFTKGQDVIALITGPLSATDTYDVRMILDWARQSETSEEFLTKVELENVSSQQKRTKLLAFRHHLEKANDGNDVSDDDFHQFLRHFHLLGYDLDLNAGVTLSLLQTVIGLHTRDNPAAMWSRILDEVQSANQSAGTLAKETLPEDIRNAFRRADERTIPEDISSKLVPPTKPDWSQYEYASELMIVGLIGSWNEQSDADTATAGQLAGEDYRSWILKVREALQQPGMPITQRNGIWSVSERMELWQTLGPRVFDDHLDRLRQTATTVLMERDPKFELPPEERYAASVHGKVLSHSHQLRQGLASSLALVGNYPETLNNCSRGRPEAVATLAVRDIFDGSDWQLWASLDNLLPLLAEVAPSEFLDAVEAALQQTLCPFDELFSQEGRGIMGGNYMTGLLWALETLAWDGEQLVRVSVILGELATRDPGGNWSNRPSNSLTTIFLPWLPQTIASIDKRKAAVETLQKQVPNAAWQLLLSLLPSLHQMSSGSAKPVWRRTIPEDWTEEVTTKEYWNQVHVYTEMAVEMARHDVGRLGEVIDHLDDLPGPALESLLEHLSSEEITGKPEDERMGLWTSLTDLTVKHKKFADAKWALSADLVSKIDDVARALAPLEKQNIHRRLFGERDIDLYDREGSWQEKRAELEKRRVIAIKEILDADGREAVVPFAESIESPWNLGLTLGTIDDNEMDTVVLPALLDAENRNLTQLARGFISSRHYTQGWAWSDNLDLADWALPQTGQFLAHLPFTNETWKRAKKLLGKREEEYWTRADVNPFQVENRMHAAVDKLIQYGRPHAAIDCLNAVLHEKKPLDLKRATRALLAATTSKEPATAMTTYHVAEVIKSLQNNPNADRDDLCTIEWAYLPLLDGHHGASPMLLEQRLATDPGFFCEAIRTLFRSKKEAKTKRTFTEREKDIAANVYRLLREWRTPPGLQADGSFSEESFKQWLKSVKATCEESGHIEVALLQVGSVLIHCPADPDGLCIHRAAAQALNAGDAEKMRNGYGTALFNARGVHTVDPSGAPELALRDKYAKKAEDVENAGYQRLAVTLRQLADSYAHEARRIVEEHKQEEEEDSQTGSD